MWGWKVKSKRKTKRFGPWGIFKVSTVRRGWFGLPRITSWGFFTKLYRWNSRTGETIKVPVVNRTLSRAKPRAKPPGQHRKNINRQRKA